jgi:hypothetical protein
MLFVEGNIDPFSTVGEVASRRSRKYSTATLAQAARALYIRRPA